MAETYTLGLALLDFVPNLLFLIGAYFLVNLANQVSGKLPGRTMAIGTGLIILGGILKASWKLLYALHIADIQLFNQALFVLQAPGFALMFFSVILILRSTIQKHTDAVAIALWKIPLLAIITLASLGSYGILAFLSFRRGIKFAAWCYILTIIFVLGMSGMAGGADQSIRMQWVEEGINSIGQLVFALGSWSLYRSYE
jgi:hypothetical protein